MTQPKTGAVSRQNCQWSQQSSVEGETRFSLGFWSRPSPHEPTGAGPEAHGLCPFGCGSPSAPRTLSVLCQGQRKPGHAVYNREERGQLFPAKTGAFCSLWCWQMGTAASAAVQVMSVTAITAAPGALEQTFSPTGDILVASERDPLWLLMGWWLDEMEQGV